VLYLYHVHFEPACFDLKSLCFRRTFHQNQVGEIVVVVILVVVVVVVVVVNISEGFLGEIENFKI
jgi:hypothetical protein